MTDEQKVRDAFDGERYCDMVDAYDAALKDGWNREQAMGCAIRAYYASATAEECSVAGRGIGPDREALMNGSLCKFGMNWLLDGDYLRCRVCKRPQIASCAHLDFPHASDCKCADDVENHPWLTLIGLLKPIAIDQAIAAKREDGNG